MTGYQEILTDPSYAGQIVTMTYPQIGNVGVNPEDVESARPFLSGFVVKEMFDEPSNWRSQRDARRYLRRHGVPAIAGIDTRALVRRLRDRGAQRGVLSHRSGAQDEAALVARARARAGARRARPRRRGHLRRAVRLERGRAGGASPARCRAQARPTPTLPRGRLRLRDEAQHPAQLLVERAVDVTVVPARRPPTEVARARARTASSSRTARATRRPCRACASRCATLARAHADLRHLPRPPDPRPRARRRDRTSSSSATTAATSPVKDLATGQVEITAQNHGFAVDADSLRAAGEPVRVTHVNLNDGTVEGLAHETRPVFSVQYHPEASPGPARRRLPLRALPRDDARAHEAGERSRRADRAGASAACASQTSRRSS